MQKEKTLEFWDELHQQETSKEWIVRPSQALFHSIGGSLTNGSCVLEIGCGTSSFSRDFYCYYKGDVTVVASDVSHVCIRENQERDQTITRAGKGRLSYQVLNVLEESSDHESAYDVIFDKGCLDTFLFRGGHKEREPLVRKLLDNVHSWLKDGGKYIVMTPRSRIVLLRDYQGFSSVRRITLDQSSSQVVIGDLEDGAGVNVCFMYLCEKKSSYVPGQTAAFRDSYGLSLESDEDTCPRCGSSFLDFRAGEDVSGKGSKYWARRWRGHRVHCKDNVSSEK